ncbi:nitronate monooxygenase family protein [Jeotgalicoccus sp. ATCC 8456]|uniref:NAD(P)H-dependent flavin oxidoreductase n=1 Tax=Jeotgalicoccus sp. ATCC 8456 TaxID=946435 RepID=UPI0018E643B2|nr:nitronate monooxygenase [Jeotgalicoccus sp. ATCC 8456]QQD85045.1 nitronate monooxygenase [Jeotgalicoccus sp. ATCC 8456]
MWNNNQLSQSLGIKYPIIQAGMAGGITTPDLVASVSNSGGLGSIGAGYMNVEKLRETIQEVKKLTDQPFSVNLFTPEFVQVEQNEIDQANDWLSRYRYELNINEAPPVEKVTDENFKQQVEVIIEENVPICSFTFGIPDRDIIKKLKEKGIIIIGTATTVDEAIANESAGMDAIVAQGSEAGGHRGSFLNKEAVPMIGTMALVPQVVDYVSIPVIAAGGISDGRGIVASLGLGAKGVQLGTAFLTSEENGSPQVAKLAILNAQETDTVVTTTFSGKPARGLLNDFIKEMRQYEGKVPSYPVQNSLTQPIRAKAAKLNRPEYMSLWCGQNLRSSKENSANQMVIDLVTQVEDVINKLFQS